MTLGEANRVAVDAHARQLDKAGKPYILHPLRVMMTVESPSLDSARKVAVLHDVVEASAGTRSACPSTCARCVASRRPGDS